jgi:hypothetical protein
MGDKNDTYEAPDGTKVLFHKPSGEPRQVITPATPGTPERIQNLKKVEPREKKSD